MRNSYFIDFGQLNYRSSQSHHDTDIMTASRTFILEAWSLDGCDIAHICGKHAGNMRELRAWRKGYRQAFDKRSRKERFAHTLRPMH